VPNFYTKVNLLSALLAEKNEYQKVLVFVSGKRIANRLFENLEERFLNEIGVIHGNKSQNFRIKAIEQFEAGKHRVLVATDVMARGLDFSKISHVINFDTPEYPENYIHRIGRTGRAEEKGKSVLLFTEKERPYKEAIEEMMGYKIPETEFPQWVEISQELIPEERPKAKEINTGHKKIEIARGPAFHEKSKKNQKRNSGGKALKMAKKYKKPKTRGDKTINSRKKRR
jgi:ATP-dependent RNA helicase RhlE